MRHLPALLLSITHRIALPTLHSVQSIRLVIVAEGFHPFPFRTRKLSPPAPMVLPIGGRVGRRQAFFLSIGTPPWCSNRHETTDDDRAPGAYRIKGRIDPVKGPQDPRNAPTSEPREESSPSVFFVHAFMTLATSECDSAQANSCRSFSTAPSL